MAEDLSYHENNKEGYIIYNIWIGSKSTVGDMES